MKRFLHLLTGICTLALALQACTKSPAENPGRTDDPGNDEQNSKVTLTLSTPLSEYFLTSAHSPTENEWMLRLSKLMMP